MSSSRSLAAAALLALAGCGFTPLYGQNDGGAVTAKLDTVEVENIPERTGQLLRESLETQLHMAGAPTQQTYALIVSYSVAATQIGQQQDSSFTRNRYTATANWKLTPVGDPAHPLGSGFATTENAENVIDQQYFAGTLENGTIDRQLANDIAARITAQVSVFFKTHPNA